MSTVLRGQSDEPFMELHMAMSAQFDATSSPGRFAWRDIAAFRLETDHHWDTVIKSLSEEVCKDEFSASWDPTKEVGGFLLRDQKLSFKVWGLPNSPSALRELRLRARPKKEAGQAGEGSVGRSVAPVKGRRYQRGRK